MAQGVTYGDYTLLGRLNRGGMAEVFLARSNKPGLENRLLAVKRTLPELWTDKDFVSMFADEARIATGLSHPNICQIYDQGQTDRQLFIVMEFVHGKDLKVAQGRARQRNELIPYRYSAYTIARMAEALDFAHHKTNAAGEPLGIVHRDVSPQNILISYDGVPKLIDFGIAKAKGRVAQTQVGVLKGKFAYMSPEQAKGGAIDHRTDVFALGVVLYELCTGRSAFKGSSDFSTLQRITQARYTPPGDINPDVPRRLATIIGRALQRDLGNRYPNAMAMAKDLDAYLAEDDRPITATTLSAYMRKLFRDDYIREAGRIKQYISGSPAERHERTPNPKSERPSGRDEAIGDATGVAPSYSVDRESSDVSGRMPAPRAAAEGSDVSGKRLSPRAAVGVEDAAPGAEATTHTPLPPGRDAPGSITDEVPAPQVMTVVEPSQPDAGDFRVTTDQVPAPQAMTVIEPSQPGTRDFRVATTDEVPVPRAMTVIESVQPPSGGARPRPERRDAEPPIGNLPTAIEPGLTPRPFAERSPEPMSSLPTAIEPARGQTTSKRRRQRGASKTSERWLSRAELLVLALVAVIGLGLVTAVYVYVVAPQSESASDQR